MKGEGSALPFRFGGGHNILRMERSRALLFVFDMPQGGSPSPPRFPQLLSPVFSFLQASAARRTHIEMAIVRADSRRRIRFGWRSRRTRRRLRSDGDGMGIAAHDPLTGIRQSYFLSAANSGRRKSTFLVTDGQAPNPNTRVLQDCDAAGLQRFFNLGQIRKEDGCLRFRLAAGPAPERHDGRSAGAAQGEHGSEIGIGRDMNSAFDPGEFEYRLIFPRLETAVANVLRVMPLAPQPVCDRRRQCVIHQELHGMASGNSRSRTAWAA